jgi:hypothetical protein
MPGDNLAEHTRTILSHRHAWSMPLVRRSGTDPRLILP